MKILFLGRNYVYFKNFDSVVRELARRGHEVHLAAERDEQAGGQQLVDALAAESRAVTYGEAPSRDDDEWTWVASRLRLGLDYLRYQHALFDDTPKLRARARERTPGLFAALGDGVRRYARWARHPVAGVVRWLERAVPADPEIERFLEARQPDLLLLTPLIDLGSSQVDYLRAARRKGMPTALCVWSWDHLSSKALIREWPDRILVWNEVQKREAVELHGVSADRIVVTGAQCFDQWFGREPSRTRSAFCGEVGLPSDRPYLLWVCSALFHGSPPESAFVVNWIERLRGSASPRLQRAPILVRPHPSRLAEWEGIDLRRFGDVVLWGGNPVDARARADYFDSLWHSAAVVGLNTSAFLEAGIVGRPVFTILAPEFQDNQLGTVHFRYLLDVGGGLVTAGAGFDEHLAQLDRALAQPTGEVRPFIRSFVRPHGLEVPATPLFADAVERLAAERRTPAMVPVPRLRRWALTRLAAVRTVQQLERWTYSERELEGVLRLRTARSEKETRRLAAMAAREAIRAAREAERHRREAEKRARAAATAEKRQQVLQRKAERAKVRQRELAAKRRAKDLARQREAQ